MISCLISSFLLFLLLFLVKAEVPKQKEDFLHQKQQQKKVSPTPTLFSWSSSPSKLYPNSRISSLSFLLPFLLHGHPLTDFRNMAMTFWKHPSGEQCQREAIGMSLESQHSVLWGWGRSAEVRTRSWDLDAREKRAKVLLLGWKSARRGGRGFAEMWWYFGGVGNGEGQDAGSQTRMADIGTDKRGLVSRRDFYPTEKPCYKVCSQLSTETSVLTFWGCRSDIPGARDTPTWEMGWPITFLACDTILTDRKGRKWVVRKKNPREAWEGGCWSCLKVVGVVREIQSWRGGVRMLAVHNWLPSRSVLSHRLENTLDPSGTYITQDREVSALACVNYNRKNSNS